jgi:aminopeptidase I
MVSADVSHAFNPNFSEQYLPGLSPELNKGMVLKLDPNGHYTTNASGTVVMRMIAERCGCEIQSQSISLICFIVC